MRPLLLFIALWAIWPQQALAERATVHVVATQNVPRVQRLVRDLEKAVAGVATVDFRNLDGRPKRADKVLAGFAPTTNDVVLALGAPASRVVLQRVDEVPIVCAMTTQVSAGKTNTSENIYFSQADAGISALVDAMSSVWTNVGTIAVVVSADALPKEELASNIVVLPVEKSGDVIDVLAASAGKVDGYVFPRDPKILNRRSINDVVDWLIEQKKPAVGYSKFLVSAGFPAAVAIDDTEQRGRVVGVVQSLLKGEPINDQVPGGSIWLNREMLQHYDIDPDNLPMLVHLL